MKFNIEVEEISQRVVEIEADSLSDAINIARDKWYSGEIVLDSDDFKCVNVRHIKIDKCSHCGKELFDGMSRMISSDGIYCYDDECQKAHWNKFK